MHEHLPTIIIIDVECIAELFFFNVSHHISQQVQYSSVVRIILTEPGTLSLDEISNVFMIFNLNMIVTVRYSVSYFSLLPLVLLDKSQLKKFSRLRVMYISCGTFFKVKNKVETTGSTFESKLLIKRYCLKASFTYLVFMTNILTTQMFFCQSQILQTSLGDTY